MARQIKELMLAELEDRFRNLEQTGCVLLGYERLKADEAMQVRQAIGERGARMTVVRNSLFRLALRRSGVDGLADMVKGGTAVVCAENPVDAAKAAKAAADVYKALQLRGGYAEGRVLGPEGVQKLAEIPSREVLLSMIAGALLAPLRRLASGLLAKPRDVLSCLHQMKEKAEQDAA
jgi:large subunit ribosomal protein L10